jgi:hypothetical protein
MFSLLNLKSTFWQKERISSKKVGDMGIDGITFDGIPIQAKQSEKVGRSVVDNFETAINRYFGAQSVKRKASLQLLALLEVHMMRLIGLDLKAE